MKISDIKLVNRKNENWANILKGLLIISVIAGHCPNSDEILIHTVYWFHMPLFFMISGYFLSLPEVGGWVVKKAKRLLLPTVVYFLIDSILTGKIGMKRILRFLYNGRMINGVYWFTTTMFLTLIGIYFLKKYVKTVRIRILIYVILYCLAIAESFLIVPETRADGFPLWLRFPWNIDVVPVAMVFMLMGYTGKNLIRNLRMNCPISWAASGICLVLAIVLTVLYKMRLFNFRIDMMWSMYRSFVFTLLVPVIFGVVLVKASVLLDQVPVLKSVLGFIGCSTIPIMFTHLLIKDLVMVPLFGENYSAIFYVFVSIVVGSAISYLSGKWKCSRLLFGGFKCHAK